MSTLIQIIIMFALAAVLAVLGAPTWVSIVIIGVCAAVVVATVY